MARMSWQYIAGFFDGEGSVGMSRKKSSGVARIFVSIPQSAKNEGLSVLTCIKDFLTENGVTIKGISCNMSPAKRGHAPIYQLALNRLESVRIFLEGVLPYVIVKKVLVQDYLRYIKLYPSLTGHGFNNQRYQMRCQTGSAYMPPRVGTACHSAKLSDEGVITVRVLLALGLANQPQLSKRFGLSQSSLSAIKRNKTWKHLLPFVGDNSAYQQFFPSRKLILE